MTKLILSAIVVVGTAFLYLWKRFGTRDARTIRIRKELADVVEEMEKMDKYSEDFNANRYYWLHNRRVQLNEHIARLNR